MADIADAGTAQPLQTVGDATGKALDDFVGKMLGQTEKAAEQPAPEPEKAETEVTADNKADLSQDPEVETPKADDDEPGLSAEQQARIQKRIDKEVRRRKEAEEKSATDLEAVRRELEQARADLEAARKAPPKEEQAEPVDTNGIDQRLLSMPEFKKAYEAEQKHGQAFEQAKALLRQLRREPEKVIGKLAEWGRKFDDPEDAADFLGDLRDQSLKTQLAMQGHRERATDKFWQNMAAEKQRQSEQARTAYPWLKDKTSAEYKHAESTVLKRFPGIFDEVDGELWLGRMTTALLSEAKPKEAATRTAPVIPPKAPPAPKAAARADGAVERSEMFKRVEADGAKAEELAKLVKGF